MYRHDVPTRCSCNLPRGQWGQSGFHFVKATELFLVNLELRRLAVTDPDLARLLAGSDSRRLTEDEARRLEIQRAATMTSIRDRIKTYIGQPFAVERCPAYLAKCQADAVRQASDRRRGKQTDLL